MADTKLSALTELAATPAADDELYIRDVSEEAINESKRIQYSNLVPGTATKEFFIPATGGSAVGTVSHYTGYLCNAVDEYAEIDFMVPHDFASTVEAVIVTIPQATQAAANWNTNSVYAANGESYSTHSAAATDTYDVTLNQMFDVDISGLLTSLSAGDYVGINITQKTVDHNVFVMGVRFKYA